MPDAQKPEAWRWVVMSTVDTPAEIACMSEDGWEPFAAYAERPSHYEPGKSARIWWRKQEVRPNGR